jgi:hypothetical protein
VSRSEPSPKRLLDGRQGTCGEVDEVENPMEAMPVSREIGCVRRPSIPEAPTARSARDLSGKGREGRASV